MNNKFDFTPGDWEVREDIYNERPEIYSKEYGKVAIVDSNFPKGNNTIEANARLIAAAPEMVSFIDILRTKIENQEDLVNVIQFIKNESDKIIEKATGKKYENLQ